ncbi:hypothetical protein GXP67_00980 [Rhodocytophaga rosea]|uniref:Uncharacterized protein n=1 Tax=Rhodocytophaga rosea TaxID=2704465 RepID=A0A6C0GBM8_9BACT|nr:hypothetical protein [Rhodocytophaga rosea]QHT65346.1 hypothetical protein GXP67_00980 [Rhodocytophaga rosea]
MNKKGTRGTYEGYDKEGHFWQLPRNVDPKLDGTQLAKGHKVLFDVSASPNSIPIDEFDKMIEAVIPDNVINRIEHVIEAGIFLFSKELAEIPPLDVKAWRRGMILSWSHARDLVVLHDAIGHPRDVAGHDMDEVVLAKHLQSRLSNEADQWYKNYVNSLDQGAWINVGFFNPHISASLYKWGDVKGGVQNAMDAHRLAAHHQGTPEHPLDWIERAVNFVVHHIPREHWGIRHEPRGEWSDLEERLKEDPAIKDSEIGKVIARDAAALFELLEKEGKVVPWQLLDVPDIITPSVIEHARLVIFAAKKRKNNGTTLKPMLDDDEDEASNPNRVARAKAVLTRLPEAIKQAQSSGQKMMAETYMKWMSENS